ncbi:MAG: phospholipid/cholesterol/gamma-HCH transport system substrate-binding protein [Solirubrobacteraceae bacterium]|nr:phospholipid/cholesterol/gamma-HCH transport system substrate-binding protein [Solirubrobacteraceae bacterium]
MAPPVPQGTASGAVEAGTVARVAAAAALALAVVIVAVLVLGGSSGKTYYIDFQNAGQLVKGDDVQVGGRRIGSVNAISLTNHNLARIKVSINDPYAPLHQGTTALVRATSLSGIANRYIALTPGPNSNHTLPDGATIGSDSTTSIVDLDQLFNTLNAPTRKALQNFIQGSATQYQGKGVQANQSAKYFGPALSSTDQVIQQVLRDQGAFTTFLANSSKLVTDVAARRNDLSSLVANANATAGAIAQENTSFNTDLALLPGTLRKANTTFVNLRATLVDLTTLVNTSKPVAPKLAPFFSKLRPLVRDAVPTFRSLSRVLFLPGPNNDLNDLMKKLPALQRAAQPSFAHSITALQKSQPVVSFIRPYTPDFVGWLRDFGQGASSYDANGHYARIQPIFNATSPNSLVPTPIPTGDRFAGLQQGNMARCPGAASQYPPDGSAPFLDGGGLDCQPSEVPPGP